MTTTFISISNGQTIDRSLIPESSFDEFRTQALTIVKRGGKVVQFFAYPHRKHLNLLAVLRTDDTLLVGGCAAPASFSSLTLECEVFHLFEREMAEQFGLLPEGHPWLKMVRYHPNYREAPDLFNNDYTQDIPGNYDYYRVDGEEIHEVAVGPVHAGVIEPGHFRFNCIGERVLHLEIQLGYQHRGIERLMCRVPFKRQVILAENIAGDTTIGHALCQSQAFEALSNIQPHIGAKKIRTIALELERLANHIGDLGALSGDVAFLPPANYFGRIRGDFLNLSLLISGSRFGKGLVRPGGVRFGLEDDVRQTLIDRVKELTPQVEHVLDLLFSASVRARFEGCGTVSRQDADHLGLVGPVGRASGLSYDVRHAFPTEFYPHMDISPLEIPPQTEPYSGDVFARAKIRADEIIESLKMINSLTAQSIKTPCVAHEPVQLSPSSFVVTVNEAWRGEVSHAILTDSKGRIVRYKIKDPSFHNWNGLAMALRNTGISDFPLNNKSFNLSYCGFDL